MEKQFEELKNKVQMVIDLIGSGQHKEANNAHVDASELLDELIDFVDDDEQIIEVSHYQVLLNQLQQKITL